MKTSTLALLALVGTLLAATLGFTTITLASLAQTAQAGPAQFEPRLTGRVWTDTNCDGIRQSTESGLPGVSVSLAYAGPDGTAYTSDDTVVDLTSSNTGTEATPVGQIEYSLGAPGETYYLAIYNVYKPAHMKPAPFQQGTDRAADNDLTMPLEGSPLWATVTFQMPARSQTHTGTDIGLCTVQFDPNDTLHLPLIRR